MAKDEAKWAYWTKQIKEWQASGLSRNAYCKREGLKPTTFDYWRPLIVSDHAEVKVAKQPEIGNDITLVPVKVIESARDALLEAIKLTSPSGREMQLSASIEPQWLIAVLRQLP